MNKVATTEYEINEAAKRRKRINLYKKIIIILIIAMILLPTILCVVLFLRLNYVSNKLDELSKVVYSNSQNLVVDNDVEVSPGEKGTEPDYYQSNTNNKNEDPTEPSTQEPTEEATKPVVTPPVETNPPSETQTEATTEAPKIPNPNGYSDEVLQALSEGRKVVYLTFDDGPWEMTDEFLDVLKQYGVNATFFINYREGYEDELIRMRDEGHTIAMHTYSHVYEHVYGDISEFESEVVMLQDYISSVTGVKSTIFRFPGGSSNSKTNKINTYINYLDNNGIVYFDWNVSSADATPGGLSAEKICNNVISGVKCKDVSVVLMHDAYDKHTTLEALPMILEKLQAMNALILPITEDTVPVHHNF